MQPKTWIVSLGALLLAGGGVWAARARAQAPQPRAPVAPAALVAPALVEGAADVLALGFETAGRVAAVLVNEGDRVTRGQLLARLDDRLARARVAQAEGALAAARARRDITWRGSRADEIRAAAAEAAAASAEAHRQDAWRDRAERLFASGAATEDERDRARDAAASAGARAEAAAAHVALARAGARSEARREADATVVIAEAELQAAQVLLSQAELRAPRDGVVLRRKVEPGEQVVLMPPTVVLTVADTEHLRLRGEVDEADIARVAVGQRGFATAEAFGDQRFAGRVEQIVGELGRKRVRIDDPRARVDTRVLEVVFALDGPAALPLGLRMDLHLP